MEEGPRGDGTPDHADSVASFTTTWCKPLQELLAVRETLPFVQETRERLGVLAGWKDRRGAPYVRVDMIAREKAIEFFISGGELDVTTTTVDRLAPEGTFFLAVTYGPEADVAAAVAFVPLAAAVYVPLLAASVGTATKDGGSWTRRGLGQLLLFLVRQFAGERTIYWQATEKARPYYQKLSGKGGIFASITADGVTLPDGVESEDYCTPMKWTSSIGGSETVRALSELAPPRKQFRLEFQNHRSPTALHLYWQVGDCSSITPLDAYTRFLAGASAIECGATGKKLLNAWNQVASRKLKAPYVDETHGCSLVAGEDIEPDGYITVFGGELLDAASASQRVLKTHLIAVAIGRDRYVVDGIGSDKLPSTHWGGFANSCRSPSARTETIDFDRHHSVKVLRASKGIKKGEYITWDYPVVDPPSIEAMQAPGSSSDSETVRTPSEPPHTPDVSVRNAPTSLLPPQSPFVPSLTVSPCLPLLVDHAVSERTSRQRVGGGHRRGERVCAELPRLAESRVPCMVPRARRPGEVPAVRAKHAGIRIPHCGAQARVVPVRRAWLAQQVRLGADAALLASGLPDGRGAAPHGARPAHQGGLW